MFRKTVSSIMLTLLLVSMLTLAFSVQPVKASGTIYINADGSISPSATSISTVDNITYTFTGNIVNESIVVQRDNIVLDGNGYNIRGERGIADGVEAIDINNMTIKNMNIKDFANGISLIRSSGNNICGNNISNNWMGIWLYEYSSGNNISGNIIAANGWDGIWLNYSSHSNIFSGNDIIANNGTGIFLAGESDNSSISGNNITKNGESIRLLQSANIRIYHNNFVSNAVQIYPHGSVNDWDDDYLSGGNWWSNYNGTDLYSGPYQNETGSDGIGDTVYVIDANNEDSYPLMKAFLWSEHDIGITYIGRVYSFDLVVPLKTIVGLRFSLNISTFVMNYGNQSETFNVQVYLNDTLVGAFANVTLTGRQSEILSLRWNTTGFAYGNYTVRAVADNLTGETDILDNAYADGIVYVGIPGDVNGDGKVDMKDIGYVARRFGTDAQNPLWDPNADLNDDEKINMLDIGNAARHFGENYP